MGPAGQKLPSPATWPALVPWHSPGSALNTSSEPTISHSYIRADLEFDELMLANSVIVQEYVRTLEVSGQFTSAVVSASVFLAYAFALALILPLSPSNPVQIYSPHPGVNK